MPENTHRPCVAIVVVRKGEHAPWEILIVHKPRRNDAWQIPQGGIEEGESVREAGRRELAEETGIILPPRHRIILKPHRYQYDYPEGFLRSQKPKYRGQKLIFVTTIVPPETAVRVDNRELDAFLWVTPGELPKYLKRTRYRKVVERVVASAA